MNSNNFEQPKGQHTPPPYQPGDNTGKNLSIASLVCGLIGIVFIWIPYISYAAFVASILGIVFGAMGRKRSLPGQKGMATAGLVLGIVALSLDVIVVICTVACVATVYSGALAASI